MLNEYGPNGTINPNTFTVLYAHTPSDSYWTTWGNWRHSVFYLNEGTPDIWFDGLFAYRMLGAITNDIQMYNAYKAYYNGRRAIPTDVTIDAGAELVSGRTYRFAADVCLETGVARKDMRVYMVNVLDNYPITPIHQRNCVREGPANPYYVEEFQLQPGECRLVEHNYTFDNTSWNNQSDIKVIIWAQDNNSSFDAEVWQAAVVAWPFPPVPGGDHTPPDPSPMTFETPPMAASTSAITMVATEATDESPPIEYFFLYIPGAGNGGNSRFYDIDRTHTDDGLDANTIYTYATKARDSATPTRNYTAESAYVAAATFIEMPIGISFGAVGDTSMEVTADGTFTNLAVGSSGLYFEMTPAEGSGANAWGQTETISVTGLSPGTEYSFRVKGRNQDGLEEASPWFGPVTQSTTGASPCAMLGDIDEDGQVQGDDIGGFTRAKLGLPPEPGENQACANYGGPTLEDDIAAFVADLMVP